MCDPYFLICIPCNYELPLSSPCFITNSTIHNTKIAKNWTTPYSIFTSRLHLNSTLIQGNVDVQTFSSSNWYYSITVPLIRTISLFTSCIALKRTVYLNKVRNLRTRKSFSRPRIASKARLVFVRSEFSRRVRRKSECPSAIDTEWGGAARGRNSPKVFQSRKLSGRQSIVLLAVWKESMDVERSNNRSETGRGPRVWVREVPDTCNYYNMPVRTRF